MTTVTVTWRFSIGVGKKWTKESWRYGFNPFPPHGALNLYGPELALQALAEEGVTVEEIRRRLKSYFSQGFIESVASKCRPGEVVHCTVTCAWKE